MSVWDDITPEDIIRINDEINDELIQRLESLEALYGFSAVDQQWTLIKAKREARRGKTT